MTFDVLLEQTEDNGYTARVLAWPDCVIEGATREEAIAQARVTIIERLEQAEIVPIEIDLPEKTPHPWLPFAGMWADELDWEAFQAEIDNYRREIDSRELLD